MATMIKQTKEEISWAEIARAREMGVLDKLLAERDQLHQISENHGLCPGLDHAGMGHGTCLFLHLHGTPAPVH